MRELALLLCLLGIAGTAHAQRRGPTTYDVVARHAQRITDFAQAASLTEAQVRAALAQMPRPPHAPTFHHVFTDTRPDGTRNVFGLMDVEERVECRYDGGDASDCRRERAETDVFWVQIDPRGEVARVGLGVPAGGIRGPIGARPTQLRAFTAVPGAPAIALVDGVDLEGHRAYSHRTWLWDGRSFSPITTVSQLAVPAEPFFGSEVGTVEIAGNGLQAVLVTCDRHCRCHLSRDTEEEARQLADLIAHHAATCSVERHVLTVPVGIRLVDDDLALVTPQRTREQSLAARADDVSRAWSLTHEQAVTVVAALDDYQMPSPRFGRLFATTLADGTRALYGLFDQSRFDACVYFMHGSIVHDAVRQCATESARYATDHLVLSVRIAPDGSIVEAQDGLLTDDASIVATHLVLETSGDVGFCAEVERAGTPEERAHRYARTTICRHHGELSWVRAVVDLNDARGTSSQWIGEIVARAAGPDGRETLVQRSGLCTQDCPCEPRPTTAAAVHDALLAHAQAGGSCAPIEEPVDVH